MISIIVPVYNAEKYVSKTLQSILKQTYQNLEIIAVNDGSTDQTKNILEEYGKKYPEKLRVVHTANQGVTLARMEGVKIARGTWIGFVDCDDMIEPDMYELLIRNAEKYDADISHCGYQMQFADGRVNYFYNTKKIIIQDKYQGMKDLLEGDFIEPSLCNKIFHKQLFQKFFNNKKINTKIKINEDLLMNYYLFFYANKSVYEDICKYHYIIRNKSVTRKGLNKSRIYDPIKVKKIILNENIDEVREIAKKVYILTSINVYNSLMIDKSNKFKKDEIKVRNIIKENKEYIKLLGRKQKILGKMILYIPCLYKYIYRFYAKYLLRSKYN